MLQVRDQSSALKGFVGCKTHFEYPVQNPIISLQVIGQIAKEKPTLAEVAHSVEHDLAKVGVASSSLVFRSPDTNV